MKRGIIIFLIVLIIPFVTAVEITLIKTSYQPQELLQAEITGNFESLNSNNVFIYKGNKSHPEPVIKDLTKQNNKYYFYANLPNSEGNFSFRIENTEYLERGVSKSDTIIRDFKIEYKNTSDLSISPGFIIPSNDFIIRIKSLYLNQDVTATFEATGEAKTISLIEGIEKSIKFSLPELVPQQSKISIGSYEIPVFLIKDTDKPISQTKFEFTPFEIIGTIMQENDYDFVINIMNTGNENLTNIELSSDLNTQFIPETIDLLEPQQSTTINLTISIETLTENQEQLIGNIFANTTNDSIILPVLFDITNNESQIQTNLTFSNNSSTPTPTPPISSSCSDMGEICGDDETCNGEERGSLEGPCCVGECEEQESGFSSWIGIILVVLIALIVGYLFWKTKRKRRHESSEDVLKERSKKYEERMKSEPKHEEVKNNLDSV